MVVRTQGDPGAVTRAVVSQVYAVDAAQPVTNVTTVAQLLMEEEFATPRFNLVLLSVFALVGLALAVVGVYGVMSSAVAQERQEIGVRMALGADAGTIARMVLARGSRLLLAGTAVGLLGSFAVGRWLAGAGVASLGVRSGGVRCGGAVAAGGRAPGVLLARPARGAHRSADCDPGNAIGPFAGLSAVACRAKWVAGLPAVRRWRKRKREARRWAVRPNQPW